MAERASRRYRAPTDGSFEVAKAATRPPKKTPGKAALLERLETLKDELGELQERLYASDRFSLLVIFQAMDAAGKDGTIRAVMSGVNPAGCQVYSFKQPSAEELDHDFLWRATKALPERGRIGIFNRSYYEEVLVVRVHPELLERQRLPDAVVKHPKRLWKDRYRSIRDLETHLVRNGTAVVKFWLHVSKDEQRRRFLSRLSDPEKNWKFSPADVAERAYWDDYMVAYEKAIAGTSTKDAPWYVIPADDKTYMRVAVSEALVDALRDLDLAYPTVPEAERKDFTALAKALQAEKPERTR
jgi:PPK2 family polyphosphate:nucleotide phosphotransferase